MPGDGLPHPATSRTIGELRDRLADVREMLDQGGAVLVFTDERDDVVGVLIRERSLLEEAAIAAQIDSVNLPSVAELIAMDDRGDTL